ncbi:MAG: DUF2652 domain-containing protein [Chloroflexi bacterium]|nr:DUF2652 domain-containing protein [Chloroflexota bacterium]MCI0575994.1 DUF2652 domain-containing protein [Chloroflexota bacterium]MCI0648224.1 DUF2652 domain-containing protein [Chloroflexota bacterium]MCI0725204.1 DUF2652 domain-containing protein [Chloroflexota bacterium]
MDNQNQRGYLVLADISGFVPYLAGVELEHAQEILSELLELIAGRFRPVLTFIKVEGDAVLAHAPAFRVRRGETLLEIFEVTYAAFRERVAAMARHSTCQCQACRAVLMLDLKFLAHYGEYRLHQLAGAPEILGLDVMLVRERWLKNAVGEATGWHGYALFTENCLQQMGLPADDMVEQAQHYGHLGRVRTYSLELHHRYDDLVAARRTFLMAEEADVVLTYDFAAPPAVVWEWLNDPGKRSRWLVGTSWRAGERPHGRTAPGASNHCQHGIGSAVETVLDWRPFDYYTVEIVERIGSVLYTAQLESLPDGGGTRLHNHFQFKAPWPRWFTRPLGRLIFVGLWKTKQFWQKMDRLMAEEAAAEESVGTSPA